MDLLYALQPPAGLLRAGVCAQGFQHAAAMVGGIISGAQLSSLRAVQQRQQQLTGLMHLERVGPLIIATLNPNPEITQCKTCSTRALLLIRSLQCLTHWLCCQTSWACA